MKSITPGYCILGAGSQTLKLTKPLSCSPSSPSASLVCNPVMPPPTILAFRPTSLIARTIAIDCPGCVPMSTMSGLVAWICRSTGGEALIIDDRQAGGGGGGPNAVLDGLAEFHFGVDGSDCLRLGIECHRRIEERLHDRQSGLFAGREDAEEFVVF